MLLLQERRYLQNVLAVDAVTGILWPDFPGFTRLEAVYKNETGYLYKYR